MKVAAAAGFTDKETGLTHSWGDIIELTDARAKALIEAGKVKPYSGDKPVSQPKPKPDKSAEKADKNVETQGDKAKGDKLKDNDEFHTKKDVKPQPKK